MIAAEEGFPSKIKTEAVPYLGTVVKRIKLYNELIANVI